MRPLLCSLLVGLLVPVVQAAPATCECCPSVPAEKTATAPAQAETGHPLKGVVVAVLAERGQLVVKHEAIPGVMHAMTMGFNVDPATLKVAQKGATVTGTLVRREGKFWLIDAQFGPPSKD